VLELTPMEIFQKRTWRNLGLTDKEYEMITDNLRRLPNWTELGLFSVMWSEHCAYKHSRALFHLFPTEGSVILEGPGENAGIVDIGDGLAVVFKVESHNHPSAIDPFQGAATGVGGILRDIFTMGARPVAILDSLRFGPPDDKESRRLLDGVVSGIAWYGNSVGVPTLGGEIQFDTCYNKNPLVNVMAVGLVNHEYITRAQAEGIGNPVMVVGSKTGRDGIHGASFASAQLDETSASKRPSVQIGDPFREKLLIEACLELIKSGAVVGIQDMGAAGLTSSSVEMASRAGLGIEIDVTKVPLREEGMTPYEIMLSESQERMLVVPKKGKERVVEEILRKWELEAAVIGQVTEDGMLRILQGENIVAQVPAKLLSTHGAPCYTPEKREPQTSEAKINIPSPKDLSSTLLKLLASWSIASKEWVYSQYDHMVLTSTVILPGQADASVIRIRGTDKAIAVSIGGNSRYCHLDPYIGGQIAVAEVARNLSCVGAKPLAVSDGLNFGDPDKPEVYWTFDKAIRGISDACRVLDTPVTGGNVSFYNESSGQAIFPTPIIGMVGLIEDVRKVVTMGFVEAKDKIFLLGDNREELWGSEYLRVICGLSGEQAPSLDINKEKSVQDLCRQLISEGIARSAHDCSEGGLAVALAESCIAGGIGAKITLPVTEREDACLFGEAQSRIIVSVPPEKEESVRKLASQAGVPVLLLGEVGGDKLEIELVKGREKSLISIPSDVLEKAWKGSLPGVLS
jgi:phosphoribosylformylglycinamidine synthase II